MKASELKQLTGDELTEKLNGIREEIFNLRMQKSTGQLERPVRLRLLRRDIARILTIMKEKERAKVQNGER